MNLKIERASALLAKLQSSSRQLLCLVDDILDYSRIDAGEIKIKSIDFQPSIDHSTALLPHIHDQFHCRGGNNDPDSPALR